MCKSLMTITFVFILLWTSDTLIGRSTWHISAMYFGLALPWVCHFWGTHKPKEIFLLFYSPVYRFLLWDLPLQAHSLKVMFFFSNMMEPCSINDTNLLSTPKKVSVLVFPPYCLVFGEKVTFFRV